ncbi:MAG: hypothetical protein LLG37_03685 [Spirochaetia bacterium]|nr:hypothetical protein [Spirochaetia bacterium]
MKIDFGFLLGNRFELSGNNIEQTLEKALSDTSRYGVFGPVPGYEKEDFFIIEEFYVLNSAYDIELIEPPPSRNAKLEDTAVDRGEKFKKKMTVLYIITHPSISTTRSPRICLIADVVFTGMVGLDRVISIRDAVIEKEELLPHYGADGVPAMYLKYLKPSTVAIYREMLQACSCGMYRAMALLISKFFDSYIADTYGVEPKICMEKKINEICEPKLKEMLSCAGTMGNSYAGCICGRNITEINEEDAAKMLNFVNVFIENAIEPARRSELSDRTGNIIKDAGAAARR